MAIDINETEKQVETENDFRAHHLQHYIFAHLQAMYRSRIKDDEYNAALNDELARIPALMTQAYRNSNLEYKRDTIGENEESFRQLIKGIKTLKDLYQNSNSSVTIGNLRDLICQSCFIGKHCLKNASSTSSKDYKMISFIKRVFDHKQIQFIDQNSTVSIQGIDYEHMMITVDPSDLRWLLFEIADYMFYRLEKYVEEYNNIIHLADLEQITINYLFEQATSKFFTPTSIISEFIRDDAGNVYQQDMFLAFIDSKVEA